MTTLYPSSGFLRFSNGLRSLPAPCRVGGARRGGRGGRGQHTHTHARTRTALSIALETRACKAQQGGRTAVAPAARRAHGRTHSFPVQGRRPGAGMRRVGAASAPAHVCTPRTKTPVLAAALSRALTLHDLHATEAHHEVGHRHPDRDPWRGHQRPVLCPRVCTAPRSGGRRPAHRTVCERRNNQRGKSI